MTTTAFARQREPFPVAVPGLSFAAAAPGLWRVASATGAVLGHIERRAEVGDDERFVARRLVAGTARTMPVGEFRSSRDAAEVFR
ncbi:hypothetical protein FLP10_16180 [Agromyces intestinalis]|uniref:Uncharacterized protein n=1 Tax=Agromyces intestinalis TaxID=2592652 RepID=A0A5C1YJZ4_9MICO|nr:hypothetical protein [Agromyces intestinalis]QEO15785.1 hypothetical protein FLP10_16180 [Agromyces intestinalis]